MQIRFKSIEDSITKKNPKDVRDKPKHGQSDI